MVKIVKAMPGWLDRNAPDHIGKKKKQPKPPQKVDPKKKSPPKKPKRKK